MRLALALGWFNYDAMLATGEPRHLDRWFAYYKQEPFGRDWHQMSQATSAVVNEIRMIAAGFRDKRIDESDLEESTAYIPGLVSERKKEERRKEIEATRAIEGL